MGIGDSIGKAVGAEKQRKQAEREQKAMRRDRERALGMAADADYEPELLSDHAAPYQRSQSPLATGFLESFLTGSQPAAVQGTRAGAPAMQAKAQGNWDRNYGGTDALIGKQRAAEQATPWAVKPFEGNVVDQSERDRAQERYGDAAAQSTWGITPDQIRRLREFGVTFDDGGRWKGANGDANEIAENLRGSINRGSTGAVEQFLANGQGGKSGAAFTRQLLAQARGKR